jgi:hypothetical protein
MKAFWSSEIGQASAVLDAAGDSAVVTLPAGAPAVRTVALSEGLSAGQKLAGYVLELQHAQPVGGTDRASPHFSQL